jgi:double zinc ribbon protein
VPLADNAGPAIKVDVRCAKCGTDNRDGRRFCSKCGGALARSCPRCVAPNEAGDDFCGDCGASLTPSPAAYTEPAKAAEPAIRIASEASSASLEGERKTVTALFADIKGSMELMEDLDPEEARAIIDPALKLMIDAVHRYDGSLCNRPAMAFSRCLARRSRTRIIHSARCTPHYECRGRSSGSPSGCARRRG